MQECVSLQQRIDYAIQLLESLKNVYDRLRQASSDIEKCSSGFFEGFLNENRGEIQEDIILYRNNIETVKNLNRDVVSRINAWYDFAKNPDEIRKITYPITFHLKKRELRNALRKTNQRISDITIENRFITERLSAWEHDLELKATHKIMQGEEYSSYTMLTSKKDELITHLKYLLATLPGAFPLNINFGDIDRLTEELRKPVYP